MPPGADEVSASIAHLFSRYAGGYQALAGQASVFHQQFMQQLKASAGSYASIEAANAASLQPLNVASSASAIAALSGPSLNSLLTSVSALLGQLLDELTSNLLAAVIFLIAALLGIPITTLQLEIATSHRSLG